MIDIFRYHNYRQYLKEYYTEAKRRSSAFSFRYFARKAELPSFNYLKLVMDGKRPLNGLYLKKFIKGLKLRDRQAKYFETMVLLDQSRDVTAKAECLSKLLEIKNRVAVQDIVREQERIYAQWYHWVIREMTLLKDFKDDPKWISKKLGRAITPLEAKESFELLKKLGLLRKKGGRWVPHHPAVRSSDEVPNLAIKKLHESFIQKALEALLTVSLGEREFAGLTIALPKHKLPTIKEKIKAFRRELNEVLSAEKNPEDVYQLNIQFYPLTIGGTPR
ncbi:MAG: TIGR02147 family protein [Deltaproteobacteria bacterium]|nr:TIGR02147 family protein [Deltaproteobacteria bacterium]